MSVIADLVEVSFIKGGKRLLDRVSLTIHEGEHWVVLGPNGAGKTTLMQILGAQLHPTSGVVQLLDELLGLVDVFDLRPRIGMTSVLLADRIPKGESVLDVVVSAAYAVTGRWQEEYEELDFARAQGLLKQMRVEHLASRSFGTLSEGEKKRVQIARALMTDPELLLLDEPYSGLDVAGRESLVKSLGTFCLDPDAPTSVLVTHHLEEIPPGITHALLMKDGKIFASGPASEVLRDELLSETFDLPLRITEAQGRWFARAI